jgi:hypothetical protein
MKEVLRRVRLALKILFGSKRNEFEGLFGRPRCECEQRIYHHGSRLTWPDDDGT